MRTPDKQTIIIPKNAVTDGAGPRNGLLGLLERAGYDVLVRKGLDRKDQAEQGDFVFRGVKGSDALAAQLELYDRDSIGILMGSDVIAEADLSAVSVGVRSDIQKLLTLGIGPCRMRFLSPEENIVNGGPDLGDRLIFSKYPRLTEATLRAMGVKAPVRRTEGADTRVNEWRQEQPNVGAFEIVGTGDTARQNKLQIVETFWYPDGRSMEMPYLDLNNVTTDLYATNLARAGGRSRDMLREIGLALESARQQNRFVTFEFNVPTDDTPNFADFGMKGPTISSVMTQAGVGPWSALKISVPVDQVNRVRSELLRRGAQDLLTVDGVDAEPGRDTSEVIRILPFEENGADVTLSSASSELVRREVAGWLTDLNTTVDTAPGRPESGTARSLAKGDEFCASRFVNEALELSRAIRTETRENAVTEAGQCFYWMLTALKSKGISFSTVLKGVIAQRMLKDEDTFTDTDRLAVILQSIDEAETLVGSGGIAGEAVSFADDAVSFSTALRKQAPDAAALAAGLSLQKLITLLRIAGIDLHEVMQDERK